MASLIIDAAVTTLVHDRLRLLHDALDRKLTLGEYGGGDLAHPERPARILVSTVEQQVRELARRALDVLESGPRGPVAPGAPRTGDRRHGGTSKHAVLGSAAATLPSLADVHLQRHRWLTTVLRRGAADPSQSHVLAPAIDTAFLVVDRAAGNTAADRAAARAFALGSLCGVASDVIVTPLLRGAEGPPPRDNVVGELDAGLVARVDAAVLRRVFGLTSTRDFLDYWPTSDDLRPPLRDGYAQAVTAAAAALGLAPTDPALRAADPLTGDGIAASYQLARLSLESWSWFEYWMWLLWLFAAPVGVILPIAAAPAESTLRWRASRLFRPESPGVDAPGEEAWSQLGTLAMSMSSIGPFATTMLLGVQVPGLGWPFAHGLIAFVVDVVAAVLLISSTQTSATWDAGGRWVIFGAQVLSRLIFIVLAILEPSGPISAFYWLQGLFPLIATGLTLLLAWIADATTGRDADGTTTSADRNRTLLLVIWPVLLFVASLITGILLRGPSLVARFLGGDFAFPALDGAAGDDPPHALARVLDESTLWSVHPERTPQSLTDLRYPTGTAPLVRMWWTGGGELQVRHAGASLRFRVGAGGTEQALTIPPMAMTPAELATWLHDHVQPPGAAAGQLVVEAAAAGTAPEVAHRLPWPQVVADGGATFRPVGADRDHAYVVDHASRAQLATPFGQRGPAVTTAEGWPIAPGGGLAGADGTGVGMAAELGTLLALGAASRINDPATVPGGAPAIGPVAQVFRRWNLDERRVNEWRMLIAGGAASEKPPRAAAIPPATEVVPVDDALPAGAAASPAVRAGSEELTNLLGWVPLFQAWRRVASDPEQSADADVAAPYSPTIQHDGRWVQPTNLQLTQAIRYLLDLP